MRRRQGKNNGFTLIELSIVLVVIGLIVGGVLVGQDLIKAAAARAQLTQIEKYNTAVNTFRNKYNAIPGDIAIAYANQFGFPSDNSCNGLAAGARDGNGLIDGYIPPLNFYEGVGEAELFWSDLSYAGFLDSQIPNSGAPTILCNASNNANTLSSSQISQYLPVAKIGNGNFIYVYENGINWFGLSAITGLGNNISSATTIPVSQAYYLDKKVDDGLPTTGGIVAVYIYNSVAGTTNAPNGNPDTASTCYNSSTNTYSTNVNNGSNLNCALSFKMQGSAR